MAININSSGLSMFRLPVYGLTKSTVSVDEGSSVTFTFTTDAPDSTYYWTISGAVNSNDFFDNTTSGSFSTAGGIGTITRLLKNDLLTEGAENVALEVRGGSYSGNLIISSSFVDVNDTSLTQYSLVASVGSINEGSSVTYTFTTTGPDGTLFWSNVGTTSAADFSDGINSGSFVVASGTGTISRTVTLDSTTEGSETIVLQVRSGSATGEIVANSAVVTVGDTSVSGITRSWTPSDMIAYPVSGATRTATAVWLDASWTSGLGVASLSDGALVSSIVDRSGNGHSAAAPTNFRRPSLVLSGLNGMPTVRFNGVAGSSNSSALVCSTPGSGAANSWNTPPYIRNPTIFAVASKSSTQPGLRCMINLGHAGVMTNTHGFFGTGPNSASNANDAFTTFFGASNGSTWNDTSANQSPEASMLNNFSIWSVVNDGTTAQPYVNGMGMGTKVGTIGGYWNGYRLGIAGGTVSTQNWQGDIAEVIIISSDFVTADIRQRLEGYLAHKWGLTSKLQANHPYKNAVPTITL